MADILSNMGKTKQRWDQFDAEMRQYEKEKQERKKRQQLRQLILRTQYKQNETTQTDKAPSNTLAVSGTLRGYVPAMSDTLSGEELGELAKKETLTEEERQRLLRHQAAKMEAARKAFQQRLWERERKQAGLDPTYPDRK